MNPCAHTHKHKQKQTTLTFPSFEKMPSGLKFSCGGKKNNGIRKTCSHTHPDSSIHPLRLWRVNMLWTLWTWSTFSMTLHASNQTRFIRLGVIFHSPDLIKTTASNATEPTCASMTCSSLQSSADVLWKENTDLRLHEHCRSGTGIWRFLAECESKCLD